MDVTLGQAKLAKQINGNELVSHIYKGSQTGKIPCSLCEFAKTTNTSPKIHFHGSTSMGSCCLKQELTTQAMLSGNFENTFDDLKLYSFSDGHLHEASMLNGLEKYGYPVDYKNIEIQKEYFDEDTGETVLVVGHPDGRLYNNTKYYVIECKAVKDYAFKKYKATSSIPLIYYGQVQCYIDMLDAEGGILLVKSRNSSEVQPFLIDRNPEYVNAQVKVLGAIQNAIKSEQVMDKPYLEMVGECQYCFNKTKCWDIS